MILNLAHLAVKINGPKSILSQLHTQTHHFKSRDAHHLVPKVSCLSQNSKCIQLTSESLDDQLRHSPVPNPRVNTVVLPAPHDNLLTVSLHKMKTNIYSHYSMAQGLLSAMVCGDGRDREHMVI